MSLAIEQTPEELNASHVLSRNVAIQTVRLMSANLLRRGDVPPRDLQELQLELNFKTASSNIIDAVLEAQVSFLCRAVRTATPESDALEAFRIECTFAAVYSIRPDYQPSELELNSFHGGNVIMHCWPYFREFAQSSTVRMEFAPPPIPLLRLHEKHSKPTKPRQKPASKQTVAVGMPAGKRAK